MADLLVKFLQGGVGSLVRSGLGLFDIQATSFMVGDEAGFTPTDDEDGVRGEVTFVGARSDIKIKSLDEGASLRVSMVIPEEEDEVKIGNVMLFAVNNNQIKPFAIIVLPQQVIKQNVSTDLIRLGFPYPGTRMVISLTIKYVSQDEISAENIEINIVAPAYANLPTFGKDTEVPMGDVNPFEQFIVNEMKIAGKGPALVIKDENGLYFTSPLWQDIRSPKYGTIDGGWSESSQRAVWIWALGYITPNELYAGTYGGLGYLDDVSQIPVLGGAAY